MDAYDDFVLRYFDIFNYAIMDIEAIALEKSRSFPTKGPYSQIHNCVRKAGIILRDGTTRSFEFQPCLEIRDLSQKERNTFSWCRRNIHVPRLSVPASIQKPASFLFLPNTPSDRNPLLHNHPDSVSL